MYLIRYEKESLKDYMAYNIDDEAIDFILSCDNGFQQAYEDIDSKIIRLHFKFVSYNEPLYFIIDKILEQLNKKYDTNPNDWTVYIKEKVINSEHIIYYYFYSHIFSIQLKNMRDFMNYFHSSFVTCDDSIYYNKISKYKELIVAEIPQQSGGKHRLFNGHIKNTVLTYTENLKLFE